MITEEMRAQGVEEEHGLAVGLTVMSTLPEEDTQTLSTVKIVCTTAKCADFANELVRRLQEGVQDIADDWIKGKNDNPEIAADFAVANIVVGATMRNVKEPEEEGWEVCSNPNSSRTGRPSLPLGARIASSSGSIKTLEEAQEIEMRYDAQWNKGTPGAARDEAQGEAHRVDGERAEQVEEKEARETRLEERSLRSDTVQDKESE